MTTTVPVPSAAIAHPFTRAWSQPAPPPQAPRGDRPRPLVVRLEGTTVRVRPVHHGDGPRLQALLRRMSLRTRWLRFHSPVVQLTPAQLRSLLEVDHRDNEILLAEVELEGRWHLAGFAEYHRLSGSHGHADAAIVLEDAWQGRGIGAVLARRLGEAAGLAGIVAFSSEVLSENRRALGFIRALAPRLERRLRGSTTEMVCWLRP